SAVTRSYLMPTAEDVPSVVAYHDHLSHAVACFAQAEGAARLLDRPASVDRSPERLMSLRAEVGRWNHAGLHQVPHARRALAPMADELASLDVTRKTLLVLLAEARRDLRHALDHWQLDAGDADKIDDLVGEVVDVVCEAGPSALPRYLDDRLGELRDARRYRDRGADLLPWWKLTVVAALVGWWTITVLVRKTFGSARETATLWTVLYAAHVMAFLLYC